MTTIPQRSLALRAYSASGQGREWSAPIHIEATVEQTRRRRPNKATISVYGLSLGSVGWLESASIVEVVADDSLLYRGNPRTVRTRVTLPDQVTEIECGDGGDVYRSASLSRSYSPGVTAAHVLGDLAAATGYPLDVLGELPDLALEGGYVVAGPVRDAMDDICRSLGATWSIQDSTIQVLAPGAPTTGGVLLTAATGLVGSPERTDDGVSCVSLLRPGIRPGRLFRLESRIIQGWFRVAKTSHQASSSGDPWQTSIDAVEVT